MTDRHKRKFIPTQLKGNLTRARCCTRAEHIQLLTVFSCKCAEKGKFYGGHWEILGVVCSSLRSCTALISCQFDNGSDQFGHSRCAQARRRLTGFNRSLTRARNAAITVIKSQTRTAVIKQRMSDQVFKIFFQPALRDVDMHQPTL
jgi:hypothetical protein